MKGFSYIFCLESMHIQETIGEYKQIFFSYLETI